jgi:hypothetical protein
MIARHDADDSFAATVAIQVQESGGKANFGVVRGISQEILPVRSEMALEKGAKRLWDRLRRSRGAGAARQKARRRLPMRGLIPPKMSCAGTSFQRKLESHFLDQTPQRRRDSSSRWNDDRMAT